MKFSTCVRRRNKIAHVDENHVGVDRSLPVLDLPRPPTSKGSEEWPRKGKGKGKQAGYAYMNRSEAGYGSNSWDGNRSAHSTWNGDWNY